MEFTESVSYPTFDGVAYKRISINPTAAEWKYLTQILKDQQFDLREGETSRIINIKAVDHDRSQKVREEVKVDYRIVFDRIDDDVVGVEMYRMVA